ncbi:hypothetical protein UFOVP103_42 [uncultured Caudovirales phage]|uniref:Uncharacterized protein n=1 Tax=uncultured Caudovirales phage TaxID=2100421 RepID=A0A6J5L512_9CAUD|nr:hypothetical protein UFOVP103_42 [uncultured Caudovirales phage]CAB5216889.1 hypothetical protein UFOVP197_13 [uncultured Caudovirales phage]
MSRSERGGSTSQGYLMVAFFLFGGFYMIGTVVEVIHVLILVGMAWTISSLYDRIELLEDQEATGEIEVLEKWEPVDTSDEREYELQQQEIRRYQI